MFLWQAMGNGMSNKTWEGTVEHAMTCPLNSKLYVYRPGGSLEVIFNVISQPVGLIVSNTYQAIESLEDNERVRTDLSALVSKWFLFSLTDHEFLNVWFSCRPFFVLMVVQ